MNNSNKKQIATK